MAKLRVDAAALCPFVIWAIIKAEAKASPEHVSGGVTNSIKPSHIAILGEKNKASMIKANKILKELHDVADPVPSNSQDRASIVDRADLLIVRL